MTAYILDGYNVIRSVEWLATGPLRDQRDRLLRFVEDRRPQGNAEVIVIFDGRADVSGPRWGGPTRVIYSDGEADPHLKRLVDERQNPRDVVVVTDDRAIERWVKAAGAKVMRCRDFLAAGAGAPRARKAGRQLAPQDVDDINEELRRLWKLK